MRRITISLILLSFMLSIAYSHLANAQDFWEQTNDPDANIIYSLAINSSGHIFAGTISGGVYRSTDNGDTWTKPSTGIPALTVYDLVINSSDYIFAGTAAKGVYRSTDNGDTWTDVNNTSLANKFIYSLTINSSDHIFAGIYRNFIARSTDNGETWTHFYVQGKILSVYDIGINSKGHIFAACVDFQASGGDGVYRSIDQGSTWKQINTGLPNSDIYSFAINSSDHIFAGTLGSGIYLSTNNGDSWRQINTGLGDLNVYVIAINGNGQIFAGTGGGIYQSLDNGNTWIKTKGLTSKVRSLALNLSGYIFAGTEEGTVFRSIQSTTSVKEIPIEIINDFSLDQNYPNPFNPSTIIKFYLPKSNFVTLKIYNLFGQEVKTLVNDYRPAGEHETKWVAEGLPSGLYYYRLQAGGYTETKKLILQK